ncbi:MAG: four helix bundle protein [Deltaproteobacteria bacterium]|nr:four helix bundle protein [Deltaproteobacteria bacterium]
MKDFHELKVWQKAHQLALAVYRLTASLPREELYGLTTQLRRSSSSIPANLAEGCGRNGDAELARFSADQGRLGSRVPGGRSRVRAGGTRDGRAGCGWGRCGPRSISSPC